MHAERSFARWLCRALIPIALSCFLWYSRCLPIQQLQGNGWDCMAVALGGSFIIQNADIMMDLLLLTPQILLLYLYADYFRQDFMVHYVYVFTRYGQKRRWFCHRWFGLLGMVAGQYLLYMAASFVFALTAGYRFPMAGEKLLLLAQIWLLNVLLVFFLALLTNMLSLPLDEVKACFFIIVGYSLSFVGGQVAIQGSGRGAWLLFLLPAAHQQYWWHTDCLLPAPLQGLGGSLPGFPVAGSVCVLLVSIALLTVVFQRLLEKKDMLDMIGGAS